MTYVKAVVAAFNQEKALVGAFSVIVKTDCETDGALHGTSWYRDTGNVVLMEAHCDAPVNGGRGGHQL